MAHRHVNFKLINKLSSFYNPEFVALEGGQRLWAMMKMRSDMVGGHYGVAERAEEMEGVATKSRPLWIQTMVIVTMRNLVIRKKLVQDSRIS